MSKLSKYYTIEVTDAFDATMTNQFVILDNMYVFETPSILLLEDEVSSPQILVDEITNTMTESREYSVSYDNKLDKNIAHHLNLFQFNYIGWRHKSQTKKEESPRSPLDFLAI